MSLCVGNMWMLVGAAMCALLDARFSSSLERWAHLGLSLRAPTRPGPFPLQQ